MGNTMKHIVGLKARAERFLEGKHAEIISLTREESTTATTMNTVDVVVNVGQLGVVHKNEYNLRVFSGDQIRRSEFLEAVSLTEEEAPVFMAFAFELL